MEAGTPAAPSRRRARLSRDALEAEFNRLLAFSDGVFAIAITLLVLQLEVPADAKDLGPALEDALPDLFAFALSFAVSAASGGCSTTASSAASPSSTGGWSRSTSSIWRW